MISEQTKSERLAAVISDIVRSEGECSPSRLVDAARDPQSEIHDCFLWDSEEALEKHLLIEARRYLRIIKIEVEHAPVPQRLVHVTVNDVGTYMPINKVVEVESLYDSAEKQFIKQLRGVVRGAQELLEAATDRPQTVSIIRETITQAENALERLQA